VKEKKIEFPPTSDESQFPNPLPEARALLDKSRADMTKLWAAADRLPKTLSKIEWVVPRGLCETVNPQTAQERIVEVWRRVLYYVEVHAYFQKRNAVGGFTATPHDQHAVWGLLEQMGDVISVKYAVEFAQKPHQPAKGLEEGGRKVTGAKPKRFRVALSFAGEHRGFVAKVAESLAKELQRERVFYDKFYEAELARPNLDTYLQGIYHDDSDLIAVFLCADYEHKEWCGLEWRAIRDLIKKKQASAIMPFRFDETHIPGLFSIDGYIPICDRQPGEVAKLILERLKANDEQSGP
jgi:hypothetical protein